MYSVHAETAEHLEPRKFLPDQIGSVMVTEVITLEQHGLITCITGGSGKLQFIPQSSFGVGSGMKMNIADIFQNIINYGRVLFPCFFGDYP